MVALLNRSQGEKQKGGSGRNSPPVSARQGGFLHPFLSERSSYATRRMSVGISAVFCPNYQKPMNTPTDEKLEWLASEEGITLATRLNIAGADPKVAYDVLREAFAAGFDKRAYLDAKSATIDRQLAATEEWQRPEPDPVNASGNALSLCCSICGQASCTGNECEPEFDPLDD